MNFLFYFIVLKYHWALIFFLEYKSKLSVEILAQLVSKDGKLWARH